MCVIVLSPKGNRIPTKEEIRKCFKSNSDGGGFMWVGTEDRENDGMVHIRKGYMKFNDFWKSWEKRDFKESDLVVAHFRIGTSGGKGPDMTHPFPVTSQKEILKATSSRAKIGAAHNGVLGSGSTDMSDTALFISEVCTPLGDKLFDGSVKPALERIASGDRVVFISGDENMTTIGKWQEIDGVYFSNKKWKSTTIVSTGGHNTPWNRGGKGGSRRGKHHSSSTYNATLKKEDRSVILTFEAAFYFLLSGYPLMPIDSYEKKYRFNIEKLQLETQYRKCQVWQVSHLTIPDKYEWWAFPEEWEEDEVPEDIESFIKSMEMEIRLDAEENQLVLDVPDSLSEEVPLEDWGAYFEELYSTNEDDDKEEQEDHEEEDKEGEGENDDENKNEDDDDQENDDTSQTIFLDDDDWRTCWEEADEEKWDNSKSQGSGFCCPVCGGEFTEDELEEFHE